MSGERADLPTLAVVQSTGAVSLFDLAEAASGLCRIASVIDGDPSLTRTLRHLGPVVDITGMGGSSAAARVREVAPDGITAFVDGDLVRTARLAEDLGLPFHSPAVAEIFVDKYAQREALRRSGLPGPQIRIVPTGEVGPDLLAGSLDFPVVVKPRSGTSSRETSMAVDRTQLIEAVVRARQNGVDALVVEEYLPDWPGAVAYDVASFVSVESVTGGGRLRHLAVTGKLPLASPFRETGDFTPCHLPATTVEAVLDVVTDAIRGIGAVIGVLHTEVKLTPLGPRIIEVNGRVGGVVPEVVAAACGYSLLEAAMRVALGETPRGEDLLPCDRVGYAIHLQPPLSAHLVRSIRGLAALSEIPGVLRVTVHRNEGDAVDWRLGSDEKVLAVVGVADDLDELRSVRRTVEDVVSISYG